MKEILPYRFIVVSGPTREWIDPVRFLTNPSTGSTGWHLARAAQNLYKELIYISGPGERAYREVEGAKNISVESTQEMYDAVHACIGDYSILVMAAAPADYYCKNIPTQKVKKEYREQLELELLPTPDILKSLTPKNGSYKHFYRIGFAAETENLMENARKKLKAKELFLICANQVYKEEKGFGHCENTIKILDQKDNIQSIGPSSKKDLSFSLLEIFRSKIPSLDLSSSLKQKVCS